jgi:dihydrolipoamide dehydrogenase
MSKGIQFLMKKNKIDVITGTGKLNGAGKVSVSAADGKTQTLEAKHIIIATGARSRELPNLPQDGKKIIGYRQALTLPKQPKTMLVVGSGAIGSELAFFYQSIGTQVTLVEFMPQIVPLEDAESATALERAFKKVGMKVMTSANVTTVDTAGEECKATVKTAKGDVVVAAEIVLSAVGIAPNVENIGLEETGIVLEKNRIKVDEHYQTSVNGVYAIGDVIATPALAHVASAEGIACVEAIAGLNPTPINYGNIPGCTYTSPEIASVGMTEKAARDAGYSVKVGKFPYTASGKAASSGAKDGFVKLIFDETYGEILGAHLVGENVTEMLGEIVVARNLEATGHELMKSIHPHPTMSEAIMEAAEAAYDECIHI